MVRKGGRGGKHKDGKGRNKLAKDRNDSEPGQDNRPANYVSQDVVMKNDSFTEYYKAQKLVPEAEWEDFMDALKKPLPVSFRITGSREDAQDLREYMKKVHFPMLQGFAIDDEEITPPNSVPWYPDEFAWQFDCSRTALRKSPKVKAFHSFLMSETNVGNISRQEVVSMIPVMFMDVKPDHYIYVCKVIFIRSLFFDRCAAPGSKTAQLLEAIHNTDPNQAGETLANGLVIANDSNYERSQMLVHQAKRLQSPCLLVTHHEGQEFPRIFLTDRTSSEGATVLQFDRILCDVPCSGDGTIRKNKTIWRTWTHSNGNGLHRLQKSILRRGCELLKVGGRLVYSTCSLNPLENEAVIASMLNEANGSLKLVDASGELPKLVRNQGLSIWKVKDKSGALYDKFDPEIESHRTTMHPSFFPPENASSLGLSKCMRVYPYMQNGGGFFLAVIEKTAPFGTMDTYSATQNEKAAASKTLTEIAPMENTTAVTEADHNIPDQVQVPESLDCSEQIQPDSVTDNEPVKRSSDDLLPDAKRVKVEGAEKGPKGWFGGSESPFVLVDPESAVSKKICDFYGMSAKFPKDLFVVRTTKDEEDFRSIYLVSPPIKKVLMATNAGRIKIVNTGVKVFKKNGGENFPMCPYRVSSEGIQTIAPFLSSARQITLSLSDLCTFITFEYPKFTEFSSEAQSHFERLEVGSCLLRFEPTLEKDYTGSITIPLVLPFFRSHVSGSLLIDKAERSSLMHRLTGIMLTEFKPMEKKCEQPSVEIHPVVKEDASK
ncbi:hypothetical protein BASA50_009538 [Batrachochytrium salamandrivorans]|uniref:SAM-dependent MTase RsmB/NOP-type domain-containing protein n=1 Tax=Batrachochytrium salamandrivorans TaxID=1357716 RepID=A0ABQ8F1A1_9FUNG|nr:hypothetical protein BASA62_009739 [Batrachochytrium salamandrivorans]KAH6586746.1 hypothetical protein BASA61_006457 [Batrachochytrium salamandrivorans]KAH6590278.1 hypothetical protein BASA50_009538 [Batrachochytrium salamandrivorans]